MRNVKMAIHEYYHIFNRGVDKRTVFNDEDDFQRFLKSMKEFNVIEPIGSIFEHSFGGKQLGHSVSKEDGQDPLVEFVAYCLNPNHYHFVLRQLVDQGIEKFMHRLGMGYTKYFNNRHKRSGALFQGPFKVVHVESNEQLLHLSAYVNLNYEVHRLGHGVSKSSWDEYLDGSDEGTFCSKNIILEQFGDLKKHQDFARLAVQEIAKRRDKEVLFLE
jgi:REP element-mobilizing transposase RayT